MKENNFEPNEKKENTIKLNNLESNNKIDNLEDLNQTSNLNNNNIINNNSESINNNNLIENNNININNNTSINNNDINIDNSNHNNTISNLNNDNINNQNNNNSIIEEEDNEELEVKFNPIITFSFTLFFILNMLFYCYTYYRPNQKKNFLLCLWPIINKNQYYRLILCHFCHQGFLDFSLSMLGLFYITKYLERDIGSIYLIIIALHGMIITSLSYLMFIWLFKFLFRSYRYNFTSQGGFSGIVFCLLLSYYLLKKNNSRNLYFNIDEFKGVYFVYLIILVIQFLSPSSLFILNISGTFSSFLIFSLNKFLSLPKNLWISDMEKIFGLDNPKNKIKIILGYFSINDNEVIVNNAKEFDYLGKFI